MRKKYRNPSRWNRIIIINDDKCEIYRYDVALSGKLKNPLKSKWTSKYKKANWLKKQQDLDNTNQQIDERNDQPQLTPNVDISSQVTRAEIAQDDSNKTQNEKPKVNTKLDLGLIQVDNTFENLVDDEYFNYFSDDENQEFIWNF